MRYLDKEAVLTYLSLTKISYDNFLIAEEAYIERLYVLKEFCLPENRDILEDIGLHIFEFEKCYCFFERRDFSYPDNDGEPFGEGIIDKRIKENCDDESHDDFQGNDFDPILHFITTSAGKISKWEFHKTDSDFFPSIPHGHSIKNHKIKLDAYTGHIFKNNENYNREKRQFIIDLWNDCKFRDAARGTIIYYLNTFPNHHWRIHDPLKLPRKRR